MEVFNDEDIKHGLFFKFLIKDEVLPLEIYYKIANFQYYEFNKNKKFLEKNLFFKKQIWYMINKDILQNRLII